MPAAELVERLLSMLRDDLEDHGEWAEVSSLVRHQLEQGSGARRQRQIAERRGGLEAVAEHLVVSSCTVGAGAGLTDPRSPRLLRLRRCGAAQPTHYAPDDHSFCRRVRPRLIHLAGLRTSRR